MLDGVSILAFARSDSYLRPEQRDAAIEQRKMVEDLFSTPNFYFSYTLDITNSQQKLDGLMENDAKGYFVLGTASPAFTWNYFLLYSGGFIRNKDFHPWCIALVHGAVFINECSLNGKHFRWSILSRRSTKRAGTRFFRRGCDFEGNVANFVETEQLVEHKETMTSFVQIRGSMPFFWKQSPNLAYLPKPVIYDHVDHDKAFNAHLEKLIHNYGAQIIINLVNQTKSEGRLESKFRALHKASPLAKHVDYEAFDFHAECSGWRYDNLNHLVGRLRNRLGHYGCFVQARGIVSRLQTGVVRTNCMDSLDRTNVVQSLIASENLSQVLRHIQVLSERDGIDSHCEFIKLFKHIWVEHANIIALQYASSEALKNDITRTGKRTWTGRLRDLRAALTRYAKNNFNDGARQDAIDLVLGHYKVDVFSGPSNKGTWLYYLPLVLLVTLSFLLLITLLFSDFDDANFILVLMSIVSTALFLMLMISRHSQVYVDLPKYCNFELVDSLKLM